MKNTGWICSFSPETWDLCLKDGCRYVAFGLYRQKSAARIRVGDSLFVYVYKEMSFKGILVAKSYSYLSYDKSTYTLIDNYPVMLDAEADTILPNGNGICFDSLSRKLTLFNGIRSENRHHTLRVSPLQLRSDDSQILKEAIISKYHSIS